MEISSAAGHPPPHSRSSRKKSQVRRRWSRSRWPNQSPFNTGELDISYWCSNFTKGSYQRGRRLPGKSMSETLRNTRGCSRLNTRIALRYQLAQVEQSGAHRFGAALSGSQAGSGVLPKTMSSSQRWLAPSPSDDRNCRSPRQIPPGCVKAADIGSGINRAVTRTIVSACGGAPANMTFLGPTSISAEVTLFFCPPEMPRIWVLPMIGRQALPQPQQCAACSPC